YASSRFVFASEIKAFLSLSSFTPAVDEQAAMEALRSPGAYEGRTEATLLKGVRRLPPGCYMKVNSSGQCIGGRWWDTSANLPPLASSYQRQVSDFRDLFLDAVQVRLRSDVPVGTCLSGGIDSSAVASIIAYLQNNRGHLERSQKDWQNTFIATFPNTEIDERRFADVVVRHIGATPHYWEFQPEQAHEYLLPTVWSMEEVYNGIAIPTWCLYRSLREKNVVVTLDGHGADELLAGYPWTLDWTMPEMNEKLSADFHFNILPAILRNFDRCSMAHGIEIRMPFLDWRVVTYCFALEASAKIGAGYTKRILRDAMKDIMPEEIRTRRQKIGFNTPMITWFNGEMSPLIEKIVGHRAWIESPFFHGPTEAAKILEKTRSKAWKLSDWNFALQSWTKMNLVLWQMLFVDREMSPNQLGSELH
ncbi:MAG: asparagine synthase C-terminal domain-containing protein, partial [Bdellovibrionales bacterium]|nr:asparagine synthase C-terminal domain-containing protein [Bdellovibrionales bacterium]